MEMGEKIRNYVDKMPDYGECKYYDPADEDRIKLSDELAIELVKRNIETLNKANTCLQNNGTNGAEENMGTNIRTEVSKKNNWWINKFRYLELKNFCRQYDFWKRSILTLEGALKSVQYNHYDGKANPADSDITAWQAIKCNWYYDMCDMVEDACKEAEEAIWDKLLIGVTEGISYEFLVAKYGLACSRDYYYDRYRKFFWLLDKKREGLEND